MSDLTTADLARLCRERAELAKAAGNRYRVFGEPSNECEAHLRHADDHDDELFPALLSYLERGAAMEAMLREAGDILRDSHTGGRLVPLGTARNLLARIDALLAEGR